MISIPRSLVAAAAAATLVSCSSMYYGMMESFGKEKRHIMVDRVEDVRDDQEDAKEQFKTTLERFKELTGADGGDHESIYAKLASDYEKCVARADDVRDRIDSIQDVAEDMFDEWRDELELFQNANNRANSEELLEETEARYAKLYGVMRVAEEKMDPVLQAFEDQVLSLKHGLNAKLVASLQDTAIEIESDVAILIADMERSINEADEFIEGMSAS